MLMNEYGKIAHDEWQNTEKIRTNCRIHDFIIMPNHIHGIIEITENKGKENESGKFKSPSQTIGAIIRGYKIATIKRIKEFIQEIENKNPGHRDCTGELQFAPTEFAPTEFAPTEFAPTEFAPMEIIKSFDFKIWQRNYYEHIIRNEESYQRIKEYIINNPQNWGKDKLK